MKREDDFSLETKRLLASRVGMRCSNPNCRLPTSGPSSNPRKSINVGVAAHITAASIGGPRYDARLTPEERRGPDNGIWCCQNCGKLVDNDQHRFSVDILRYWKNSSEMAALSDIERPQKSTAPTYSDQDLIRFYAQCFDRPAFQDRFHQEGSTAEFDKAIEDTITAINTGCLRSRDGANLDQAKGKSFLQNASWRQQMDTIVDLLRAIRSRYEIGKKLGLISGNDDFYCVQDWHTAEWMDKTREEVLTMFADMAVQAGVTSPRGPISRNRRNENY